MKRSAVLSGAAFALLLTGCTAPVSDTSADVKALKDNEIQWNQDFAAKDAAKLMAHYADDAVLVAPGGPAANGKDAIRNALTEMVKDPAMSLKFQPTKVEVAKSGDLGFTEGSYTLTVTDPATKQIIHDHGSYVTTYRKAADGTWKAVVDVASSEVPPPAPAPAQK